MALIDGLTSYYKLDGDATDAHGTNDGTATGITWSATNLLGTNSAEFDGADSSGDKITTSFLPNVDDGFTCNIWINTTTTVPASRSDYVVNQWGGGGVGASSWQIRLPNGGGVIFAVYDSSVGTQSYSDATAVNNGVWRMITIVIDATAGSGTLKCYIDATEVVNESVTVQTSTTRPFTFGVQSDENSLTHYDGKQDECGVWERPLSSTEITELYNSGAGFAYPFESGAATSNAMFFGGGL